MQILKIKNKVPIQENFIGNGAIYHGFAAMPDNAGRTYSEDLCDMEADRAADMKLKLARTYYGAYAYEPETDSWNWENERMTAFYAWLKRMKDRNIDVAINIGWWSVSDLTAEDGSACGTLRSPTWEEALEKYGNWVSESVHQIIEVHGFTNVKIVVLFTEPQHDYEGWLDEVRAAHNALVRDNRRHLVKLMGPNEAGDGLAKMVAWAGEHAKEYIDIYSSHTYQQVKDLPPKYRRTGACSPMATVPGGRVVQTVKLERNTDYTMKMVAAFHSSDPLHVSGYILYGAFETSYGHVLAGGDPTTRLTSGSVKMLDPSLMPDEYTEYSFHFNSGEHDEAYICFFYDVRRPSSDERTFNGLGMPTSELYVDSMHLYKTGSSENILVNPEFTNGYEGWNSICAGGTTDAYYDWYQWGKNGILNTPEGMPFIFDEYNMSFEKDHTTVYNGANICNAAVALMNSGVAGSLLWTVFDQQWPNAHHTNDDSFVDGDHRCGTMPVLTRSLVPYRSFYAFTLLSRYTGGAGSKVYEGIGANNMHCTMNTLPDGTISIIVVNNKAIEDELILIFEKNVDVTLRRHLFDPNILEPSKAPTPIAVDKIFENIANQFTDTLPPYGMAVYTTLEE